MTDSGSGGGKQGAGKGGAGKGGAGNGGAGNGEGGSTSGGTSRRSRGPGAWRSDRRWQAGFLLGSAIGAAATVLGRRA